MAAMNGKNVMIKLPERNMRRRRTIMTGLMLTVAMAGAGGAQAQRIERGKFADPPATYRPTVTVNEGAGVKASMEQNAERAIGELNAGGIMFSPEGDPARHKPMDGAAIAALTVGLLDRYPATTTPWLPKALPGEVRFGSYLADGGSGKAPPSLGFMTPEWFSAVRQSLDLARRNGRYAIFYDEVGFPSGSADGTIPAKFYRKLLQRDETTLSAGQPYRLGMAAGGEPTSLIAFDAASRERVDLLALAKGGATEWIAPPGNWLVQRYSVVTSAAKKTGPDYYGASDYFDAEAVNWFIRNSYDRAYEGLSAHFGKTILYSFFDDVGIFSDERTWSPAIADRFEKLTGKSAALYYPALWDDIGPDTAAARVGFFKARAELLGEGFPKQVTQWARAHGVKSTGHAPGNYDLQPTDLSGDPFKFYAYTDVPMVDVLWGVGFARGGFKLISSVSAQRDLPETFAEAFSVDNDANGYRRMIELFVRGINRFVLGGRQPSQPLGTPADLANWAGRSSYLLHGGRHVADIAVLFPIESLQAFYSFNAPDYSPKQPKGTYAYRDADYQAVGEMLLSEVHRDFTFVHPDALAGDKLQLRGRTLELNNKVNREQYRALILPGGEVLSVAALRKIKAFWDAGGTVIATSLLPSRSAEFGKDAEIREMVAAMFGDVQTSAAEAPIHRNAAGGQTIFLATPSAPLLRATLDRLKLQPDVAFDGDPLPVSGKGVFGYTHRQRDGKDIYYFGNSSDTPVRTGVTLRGRITGVQLWNPHTGVTTPVSNVQYRNGPDGPVTHLPISVEPLTSLALVGSRK